MQAAGIHLLSILFVNDQIVNDQVLNDQDMKTRNCT